jgi:hypothetical protein
MTVECDHKHTATFTYNDWVNPETREEVCLDCQKSISTTEAATPNDLVGERHEKSGGWHPKGTAMP